MEYQINNYPSLTKSYKNYYPFKIGTTSFIYPDLYVPNVKKLGPFVDEIELLLFESAPVSSLFPKAVISELKHLSQDLQVSYNIHMPTDISISDPSPLNQDQAVDTLVRVIERLGPLSPTSHTLHVPYSADVYDDDHLQKWQDDVFRNLEKIILSGVPADKLALETLDYPLGILMRVIEELKLSACLDVGHLIISNADLQSVFDNCSGCFSIIHLHGVQGRKDHGPLSQLPENLLITIVDNLKRFTGTVSLEVFNFENLKASLNILEQRWNHQQ